jgi:hypothetical protein
VNDIFWRRTRDMSYVFFLSEVADDIKAVKVLCPTNNLQWQQPLQLLYITVQPLVYARCHKNDRKTEFPFCKPTETVTTARQIKVSRLFQNPSNNRCGVCNYRTPSMLGCRSGFEGLIKGVALNCCWRMSDRRGLR